MTAQTQVKMPDGNMIEKEKATEDLINGIAEEFRQARKMYMGNGDWIRLASKAVVGKVFQMDAYFEQMLALQASIAEREGVKQEKIKKIIKDNRDD